MNLRIYRKLKKDKLLNACLNILNEETEEDNAFRFDYTKDYTKIDANTLTVTDTHTKIDMDGKTMKIIIYTSKYETIYF